ncbi:MFS transporter [Streptomyces sp. NBC_01262]|uniref:MFS transporter n=1 Tax=Streptomyces sp. NBC_01262 TaxID=2903803 RepID=UPI002E36CEF8|nr:MFS transporter [Streptomyces sp. NBC_01262]
MAVDFSILKDRSVLSLLSARSISLLGNAMAPVALAFTILQMPGGSATDLGLVLTARLAAQVVFVLIGGVIADRLPKHRVMVGADIVAGLAQATVATLVIAEHATPLSLAFLAVVSGAAAAVFEPASRSVMPQLISRDLLQAANALLQLSMRGGSIIGAAIAGVLVALIGSGPTLAVDAASFLVSAVLLSGLRLRSTAPGASGPSLLVQLRDGWREFIARQWVWGMVSQLCFVNVLLAGGFYVLGPVVAKESLGGAPAWGVVLTAQALGFVVGSTMASRVHARYPLRLAALLTMGFPLPLLLLAVHAPVAAIAVLAFAAGACIDVYEVLLDTALQQHVPEEMLARVMSYESVGSFAFVPLGLAIAGPVSASVGTGQTLTGAALLIMIAGPVVLLLPSVRGLRGEEPTKADTPEVPAEVHRPSPVRQESGDADIPGAQ